MTTLVSIPPNERHVLRVFSIDMGTPGALAFGKPTYTGETEVWPLREALGGAELDKEFVEMFPVEDLGELGLSGYLSEGYSIEKADLAAVADALSAIEGYVLLIWSKAFDDAGAALEIALPLTLIATLQEPVGDHSAPDLASEAAQPYTGQPSGKKPPSNAAMSGRVATYALLLLFALAGLMIWIGG